MFINRLGKRNNSQTAVSAVSAQGGVFQAKLDAARDTVNTLREEYRQKFLLAEQQRQEELAAQEAALRAELEKSAPSPKGKSAKSPKKGKK